MCTLKQRQSFCPSKLARKKYFKMIWIFLIEIMSNKVRLCPSKFCPRKYVETTSIFCSWKLCWTKYIETTSIFCSSKLRRRKYDKSTSIFHPSELHRKNTSKWRGNSSIFYPRRIDVILLSNRRRFDVVCPLGIVLITFFISGLTFYSRK